MHEVDFADVVGKRPVMLLFSTPALCQSRVCGPVNDVAEEVKSESGDAAAWVHMEIYEDNELEAGFRPQVRLPAGQAPVNVLVGDFNRDGRKDLAVALVDGGRVAILLARVGGGFRPPDRYTVGTQPYELDRADLNGDRVPDLVTANQEDGNLSILRGRPNGTFHAARNLGIGGIPYSVEAQRLNGDAGPDLAVANHLADEVRVRLNRP
jgi:hypothetical protein